MKKTTSNGALTPVDLNKSVPGLIEGVEPAAYDLMSEYWSPEKEGEARRVYFQNIRTRDVQDEGSGEVFQLNCAFFIEPTKEGIRTVSNGSKRLVAALQNNDVKSGTPLLITFLGKKKNATNSFKSDRWSIRPLILKK